MLSNNIMMISMSITRVLMHYLIRYHRQLRSEADAGGRKWRYAGAPVLAGRP